MSMTLAVKDYTVPDEMCQRLPRQVPSSGSAARLLVVHNDAAHQHSKILGFQACLKLPIQKGLRRIGCFGSRTLAG